MSKVVLFQVIHVSISTLFTSIWPIDRSLSGATNPGQNGPGSDSILQSSSITRISPSDCLVSYTGHSLWKVLTLFRGAVGIFYSPSWLGKRERERGGERERERMYVSINSVLLARFDDDDDDDNFISDILSAKYSDLVVICCLLAYQLSWVIKCHTHPYRRTAVKLFNP